MSSKPISADQRRAAKIAGISYLIIIVAGVVAEFLMRSSLIVPGDATATMDNILQSESLFRSSIVLDLIMIGADMIVAVALYVLLGPVNRNLALLAAFFRLVMDSILGANLLNLLIALTLARGDNGVSRLDSEQVNALAMTFIDAHALGYSIALVPFGFATLIVGYLIYTSNYVPRVVAVILVLAGLTYLSGSTIHILSPRLEETFAYAYLLPLVAETSLALWLSIRGPGPRIQQRKPVPALAT